jgi:hypothetical protein
MTVWTGFCLELWRKIATHRDSDFQNMKTHWIAQRHLQSVSSLQVLDLTAAMCRKVSHHLAVNRSAFPMFGG